MDSLELATLFPVPVKAVIRPLPESELPLTNDEAQAVARAVAKRRRDFSAGRSVAHETLTLLGVPASSLPRLDDGRPEWPEGVVGTITHSKHWCAAAVARAEDLLGIGLDIEECGRLSDGGAKRVLSEAELAECREHPLGLDVGRTLKFSAKESVYKCLYPLVRRYIDFNEAEIMLGDAPEDSFTISLVPPLAATLPERASLTGRSHVAAGSVVTAVTLLASR